MEKSEKGTGRSKSHASRACTTCRRSRTRCLPGSQSSGVCARCETKGIECQWETGPDRRRNRADTQAHVEHLQTRIAELEAQLLLMSTHSCAAAVAPLARAAAAAESALPVPPPLEMDKMRAPTVERTSPTSTTTPPSAGQLQPDETGELHWHTETNVFDPTLADRHPQQKKAETLAFLPVPLDNKLHVELIELAFAWHLSVFRVLEREDVDICSERLTRYSPFVHLTVLATGSRYLHDAPPELYTDPSDPATRGEPFANAALELLVDELRNPKLSTIMGLCNLASYTGGVGAPRAGWLYAGLACRLCIDFGLHIDPSPTDPIDPSLRLIRRRLFWLCFSHDVSWAICLGRRSSFQLSEMHQPPLEPPPSAVAAQGAGTELLPGDGAAWPFEIRLNVLAWKIVELNYTDEGKRLGAQQRAERVVEVWRELGEFYESLPSIYRGPSMFIKSPDTLQLNLHYYMLIILLLKPFYAPTSATEIDPSIHRLALEQCAAAPMAILDLATKYEAAGLPLSFSSKNTYLALLHAGAMSVQIAASLLSPSAPSPPSPAPSSALSDSNSEFHHRLRAVDSSLRFLLEASKSWESCKQSMMVIGRLRAGLMERVREVQEKERGSERERLPPISVGQAVAAIPLTTAAVHQPQHHHQHQQQQQQPPPPSSGYHLPSLPPLTASPPEAPPSLAPPPPPPPHPAALPHSSALPYPGPLPTPPAAAYDPNLAFDLNFAIGGAGGGGVGYDQFVGMDGGPGGAVYGNGPGGVPLDSYLNSGWTVHNYLGTPTYLGGL